MTNFVVFRWCATYHWKDLDKGYNFALQLIPIGGLYAKLWGSKVAGVSTLAILGSPGTKCHLDVGFMKRHIVSIKGKVVASPKFEPWWVLWIRVCLWLVLAPKVFKLCTNQLVVWFCVDPCEWLMLVVLSSPHPGAPARPFTPQSVASQGACPDSLLFRYLILNSHLNLSRSLGMR